VAAVLGVLVLDETLTPAMIVGFALVTIGSILATRRPAVAGPTADGVGAEGGGVEARPVGGPTQAVD
jgi:hypothetical protein